MKNSSNVVGDSYGDNNFPYKLLLIHKLIHKFQNFVKLFANNSSANIKLSETQLHKIGRSGGFSGRLLGPLGLQNWTALYEKCT